MATFLIFWQVMWWNSLGCHFISSQNSVEWCCFSRLHTSILSLPSSHHLLFPLLPFVFPTALITFLPILSFTLLLLKLHFLLLLPKNAVQAQYSSPSCLLACLSMVAAAGVNRPCVPVVVLAPLNHLSYFSHYMYRFYHYLFLSFWILANSWMFLCVPGTSQTHKTWRAL